jgi:hypothetical protein
MKRLMLFGLVLLLSACRNPDVSTPAPTPEAINVTYPSALQAWADKSSNCASNDPQIALYFTQSDTLDTTIHANDIVLELGQTTLDSADSYLSQVGWEQVIVVVNKDNPLSQLSKDELKSIYSGQILNWENGSGQPIQVWVLPEGESTRTIFDDAIIFNQSLTTEAMLAPDPAAMIEAISKNINAIGYLPGSFLTTDDSPDTSNVKIVQLETSLVSELQQPVIAITPNEPTGVLRNLLVCLQGKTP